MKQNNLKGCLILCTAALIWGLAFVAQSSAADNVPPFLMNSLRSFISAIFLFIILSLKNIKAKGEIIPKNPNTRKTVLLGGFVCGFILAVAINFQQFGIAAYPKGVASEAHAGFITALYVVLVPLFSAALGKKITAPVWCAVAVVLAGLYMLCFSSGIEGLYLGDLLMLCCAVSFTFHILSVERFVDAVGGIRLSMLQFLVCAIVSGILSLIFEVGIINWQGVLAAAAPILYLGIMSSGVGYTLQIIGQRYAEASIASLSMSLESVFAALGGWLILGNTIKSRELIGCVLVFAAIVLAQLPERKRT